MKLALIAGLALAQMEASPQTIVNKDKSKYDLEIACDGATTKSTIAPNAKLEVEIHEGCVIKLGTAHFTTHAKKNLFIKDGKLGEE